MKNDPVPKKYTSQGLSLLHARVMTFFDTMEDEYYEFYLDNLYIGASFCKKGKINLKKRKVSGVAPKRIHNVPNYEEQEVNLKKKKRDMWNSEDGNFRR